MTKRAIGPPATSTYPLGLGGSLRASEPTLSLARSAVVVGFPAECGSEPDAIAQRTEAARGRQGRRLEAGL